MDSFVLYNKMKNAWQCHVANAAARHFISYSIVFISSVFSQATYGESSDSMVQLNINNAVSNNASDTLLPNGVKLNDVPYNHQEFLMYYKVLVYNGNVELAYQVATRALKNEPNSILWRKKLAQVAIWSGHPDIALEQWMYFISHNITPDLYIVDALKLAIQINDYDTQRKIIAYKLAKSPGNKPLLLQYIDAVQNQGYPLEALKITQSIAGAEQDKDYLEKLVFIARTLDDQALLLRYLKLLYKQNTESTEPAVKLAEYFYLKGDVSSAYNVLHAAEPKVKKDNIAYWNTYGAVAYTSGNMPESIKAYQQVLNHGALDTSLISQLVNMEEVSGQKETAYQHALIGYHQFHQMRFIPLILGLGESLEKWQDLKIFMRDLPLRELRKLQGKPESAIQLVNIDSHVGLINNAFRTWVAILNRWPNNPLVQQSYTWFLIDNNAQQQLTYILQRWCQVFLTNPKLWEVYVAGLINTGDYPRALQVMLQHHAEIYQNYDQLITIANMFEQNNRPYPAYYLQKRAFHLLWNEIKKSPEKMSLLQELSLAQLMVRFSPAVVTAQTMATLSLKWFKHIEVDNQILSWALEKNHYALASYIEKIHTLRQIETPPDAALAVALIYNDHPAMAKLLHDSPKLLPYRDRVQAAVRIENMKLAEQLAYQGLKEHPNDAEMYELFTETMLARSNKWSISPAYKTIGGVAGPVEGAHGRYFVTPSLAIYPYAQLWSPKTTDITQVAWVPSTDISGGVRAREYIHKGWIEARIGTRKSLEQFLVAGVGMQQQLSSKLYFDGHLNYHARATETAPLELGGIKNEAILRLNYNLDSYNIFNAGVQYMQFQGQDGSNLGTGQQINLHWQRKLALRYPDWNVNVYGIWVNYQDQQKIVSAPLQQFVPVGTDPTTSFFMPLGYTQGTVTFGAGQQFKNKYTQNWKPFFEAGFSYSIPFGLGEVAEVGVGGSVFGRDHLVFFGEYSLNQQQGAQQNLIIGIRYDNYF